MDFLVIYDMDDTLYNEFDYVESGLQAVAQIIASRSNFDETYILSKLVRTLTQDGRAAVFQTTLRELGIKGISSSELLRVYRNHSPNISLFPDAKATITATKELTSRPAYVVTDGNRLVQRRKANALQLPSLVQRVYYSRDFGIINEKPSDKVFRRIANLEGLDLKNLVYVGDDPTKDFKALVSKGGLGIRKLGGRLHKLPNDIANPPSYSINSLSELPGLLKWHFKLTSS
tara:strand:- start:48 stop:740 length:693 start_codon:yes stop_codon:yes gene_type:complete